MGGLRGLGGEGLLGIRLSSFRDASIRDILCCIGVAGRRVGVDCVLLSNLPLCIGAGGG